MRKILILGGAGFIGSNLVKKFCESGCSVTVIDAFFSNTGASLDNLKNYLDKIQLIKQRVEDVSRLDQLIEGNEIIIDSMGWTAHHEAIKNPEQDIQLNVLSHLTVINALKGQVGKSLIYLGSRGQYGNLSQSVIKEDDCLLPEDVQGINKLSAEFYYRVYAKFYNYNIISLRIPNCFGEGQVFNTEDIGLIGGFIKEAINDNTIEVYGNHRKRSILYVNDLAEIVFKLKENINDGFKALNVNGLTISISNLAKTIIEISKSGKFYLKPVPDEIVKMDMGSASLSETKLRQELPDIEYTDLRIALNTTINYFKQKL